MVGAAPIACDEHTKQDVSTLWRDDRVAEGLRWAVLDYSHQARIQAARNSVMLNRSGMVVVFPVYNGAETLRASLECIASQEFQDIRVIILENCSTDDTVQIATSFCERDSRFSIVRNEQHLSAMDNFAKAFRLGAESGEFFCLRACDDFSSADFIAKLVGALQSDDTKLLAACSTKSIRGNVVRLKHPSPSVFGFSRRYAAGDVPRNLTFPAEWVYGVFRSSAIDTLMGRWYEFNNPWCVASYVIAEFVIRDLVAYVPGPTYDFMEGSGSEKKYGAKSFRDRLQQRLAYTHGCYKLHRKLPRAGLFTRMKFFKMCWNDARRKTRYKLLWVF